MSRRLPGVPVHVEIEKIEHKGETPTTRWKRTKRRQKKAFMKQFGLTSGRQLRRAKKRMKRQILAKMRGEQP